MKLLISTTATQPNAVIPQACNSSFPVTCPEHRGGTFNKNASTTWNASRIYSLEIEHNLGNDATGDFGWDNVTLGLPGSLPGNITLSNQLVAGIINQDFYLANWGLRPQETNLTTMNNRYPSVIQNLKAWNYIPSKAWAYTAGAFYRSQVSKAGFASLTLGGYDSNRYVAHNTTFNFATDIARDLVVGIQSIKTNTTSKGLLDEPIQAFLDAGVPHIWLPRSSCEAFSSTFNLSYNATNGLYFVNESAHNALLAQNPNITFTLSNDLTRNSPSVNISLPYAAFDLTLTTDYPGIATNTRYFPLRQAQNESQYTLGRTFFQEAYVIADYERSHFSVHQTRFPDSQQQSLQAVAPLPGTGPISTTSSPSSLSTNGKIALSVIFPVTFTIILAILFLTRKRWLSRITKLRRTATERADGLIKVSEFHQNGFAPLSEAPCVSRTPPELHHSPRRGELDGGSQVLELRGSEAAKELEAALVYELSGSDAPMLVAEEGAPLDSTESLSGEHSDETEKDITEYVMEEGLPDAEFTQQADGNMEEKRQVSASVLESQGNIGVLKSTPAWIKRKSHS